MSASIAARPASSTTYNNPIFWERLWRSAGIQFLGTFIVGYFVYGIQPHVGASADALTAFYVGSRTRILIAAIFGGMSILNLMWFAAAIRTTLADAGLGGWGSAATASSAAVGGVFTMIISLSAAIAFSIAAAGNQALTSALYDFIWACFVLSSFPRAMLVMSSAFGLWRAKMISNSLFTAGVGVVVLGVLGGTTWMSNGFWSPDGVYSRFVWPILSLAWLVVVSRVLARAPATRSGW
jgi:hypothetical protein